MWTCFLFLLLLVAERPCVGFQCHVCSYSSNTDKNRDCIDALDTLTAPGNFYICNRTCIIQENYSLEQKKVTSYLRSCSSVTKSDYCVKDTWNLVCFFSCTGPLCNNYPGELHRVLHLQEPSSNTDSHSGDSTRDSSSNDASSRVSGDSRLLFLWSLLVFGFFFLYT